MTEFFKQKGFDLQAVFTGEDTSTVAKAAAVLGVEDGMIAKSLAFRLKDGTPIVLVVCGTGRIDNHKFKEQFHCKASMLSFEDTLAVTGHPGGRGLPLCPARGGGRLPGQVAEKISGGLPCGGHARQRGAGRGGAV